jgi:hypothetical protein
MACARSAFMHLKRISLTSLDSAEYQGLVIEAPPAVTGEVS